MKILITGNCGFIGQNFVRIYNKVFDMVGVDKMGYASDKTAASLIPTYKEDFSKESFFDCFEKINKQHGPFDAIINFGAESHVDNSIKNPKTFLVNNYLGVFNLLEIVKKHKIAKFIQISTDEVYGDLGLHDPPFSDFNVLKPSSPYSASKAASDLVIMAYQRTYDINAIIVRMCNNYGPYQFNEKFLPTIINNALRETQIPIYGDGSNVREWIYVEDSCRALEKIIKKGICGKIYNVGSGIEKNNIEVAKLVLKIMNKPKNLLNLVKDRKGHDFRYSLNSEKTKEELNWKARNNLESGLVKTIQFYKDKYEKEK